jgi:hypothetical protein
MALLLSQKQKFDFLEESSSMLQSGFQLLYNRLCCGQLLLLLNPCLLYPCPQISIFKSKLAYSLVLNQVFGLVNNASILCKSVMHGLHPTAFENTNGQLYLCWF